MHSPRISARRRWLPVLPTGLFILGTLGAPPHATAQSTSRGGGGLALGLTPNLAEGFSSDQLCPKRSGIGLSARATFALTRIVQLEALGELFHGPGNECVDGLIPPPPPTGPYTRTIDYYDARITDPPTVLALRVGGSLPKAGTLTLRPYVGIARFAGKRITSPQVGLSVLGGGTQLRLLLEAEGWWYSVPQQRLVEEFFDGQLVRRSLTEHGVSTFTTIFRFGFASAVGRG
jgi:hypothetical protein